MANVGYARVSTITQSLNLQLDDLKKHGCIKIFQDVKTGANQDREQLQECLSYLREGDTLVIWTLDRLARSVRDLLSIFKDLGERKINVKSIKEQIDTTTPMGKFTFHIMASMIEMERDLIRERTMAGLISARARGRKGGRKPLLNSKQEEKFIALYKSGVYENKKLCEMFKMSESYLYKFIKRHKLNGKFEAQALKLDMQAQYLLSIENRGLTKI